MIHVEGELACEERSTLCKGNLFCFTEKEGRNEKKEKEKGENNTPPQLTGI